MMINHWLLSKSSVLTVLDYYIRISIVNLLIQIMRSHHKTDINNKRCLYTYYTNVRVMKMCPRFLDWLKWIPPPGYKLYYSSSTSHMSDTSRKKTRVNKLHS